MWKRASVNAHKWLEIHLSSCKSYRQKNHLGKKLIKINQNYQKVFGCETDSQAADESEAEENDQEESKPEEPEIVPEEPEIGTEESEPDEIENNTEENNPQEVNSDGSCGSYAENEEIQIENNKCVLDLGSSQDLRGDWKFTFEFKLNSTPETDDRWWSDILSGIGSFCIEN